MAATVVGVSKWRAVMALRTRWTWYGSVSHPEPPRMLSTREPHADAVPPVLCPRCRHPAPPDAGAGVALIPIGGWAIRCTSVAFACPRCGRVCQYTAYKPVPAHRPPAGSDPEVCIESDDACIFAEECPFGEDSIFADADADFIPSGGPGTLLCDPSGRPMLAG